MSDCVVRPSNGRSTCGGTHRRLGGLLRLPWGRHARDCPSLPLRAGADTRPVRRQRVRARRGWCDSLDRVRDARPLRTACSCVADPNDVRFTQAASGRPRTVLEDDAIVRFTIELAHSLGLGVVAEGVESEDILERLGALGCDPAQGYCLSRPVPAADLSGRLGAARGPARLPATRQSAGALVRRPPSGSRPAFHRLRAQDHFQRGAETRLRGQREAALDVLRTRSDVP